MSWDNSITNFATRTTGDTIAASDINTTDDNVGKLWENMKIINNGLTTQPAIPLISVWATSTAYVVNQIVIRNYTQYICISNHTSGTFYTNWLTNNYWVSITPAPGEITIGSRATATPGYLLCDGKTIGDASSSADYTGDTYRELYEYIGAATFGGTFNWANHDKINLPDFRGIFPKGAGTTDRVAGVDASGNYYASTLGSYYQDKMQGHYHTILNGTNNYIAAAGSYNLPAGANATILDTTATDPSDDGTNGTPRTGHTTEPQSLGITFMIKY